MKVEGLKDGTSVVLRTPTMADVDATHRFFLGLAPEDRKYLRIDVTRREVTEERIRLAVDGKVYRLLALVGEEVVGVGVLELARGGWQRHTGELRVMVAQKFRRQWLGALLIGEIFREAQRREVEKVIAEMADVQVAARKVCERLGFHVDAVLPEYLKDAEGNLHSMIVMSCTFDEMWKEMRDFYVERNWPDG